MKSRMGKYCSSMIGSILPYYHSAYAFAPSPAVPAAIARTERRALLVVVPTVRLELTRLTPLPPQDSVSTNSTTSARAALLRYVHGLGFGIACRRGGGRRRGALRHVGRLALVADRRRRAWHGTLLHHVRGPAARGAKVGKP